MSRYFVDDAPVAVPEWDDDPNIISDRAPNVIYVRGKMSVSLKAKVTSEMFVWNKDLKDMESRFGENETALLIHNIVRWEGPDLAGVPCTRENIMRMNPTEPHIARVLEVIAERNKAPTSPKELAIDNTSQSNGSMSLIIQTAENGQSESMDLRSPLLSAITGHQKRSGN